MIICVFTNSDLHTSVHKYRLDHLASFSALSPCADLITPDEGLRQLDLMVTSSQLWQLPVWLVVTTNYTMIFDEKSGEVMETFPVQLIESPTCFSRVPLGSGRTGDVLSLTVLEDVEGQSLPEMHMFKCEEHSVSSLSLIWTTRYFEVFRFTKILYILFRWKAGLLVGSWVNCVLCLIFDVRISVAHFCSIAYMSKHVHNTTSTYTIQRDACYSQFVSFMFITCLARRSSINLRPGFELTRRGWTPVSLDPPSTFVMYTYSNINFYCTTSRQRSSIAQSDRLSFLIFLVANLASFK